MTYLIKAHHHDATPVKYTEITEGDTIARPVKDTYQVGIAHSKANRKWVTEQGEILATPSHRRLFRINRREPKPDPATNSLIIAYRLTTGTGNQTSATGWELRWSQDGGYWPIDGTPIHGEDYFLPEEIHDWTPAQIQAKQD